MVAAVDSMAWAVSGGTPWHKLGVPFVGELSPAEMQTTAGLDWEVKLREFPKIDGVESFNDKKMLLRANPDGDDKLIDVVGTRFKPVQNHEIMEFFDKFVRAGNLTMETAGSLKGGKFVWALAKTREGFTLPGGDEVLGYLLLMLPHVSGWALTGKFVPTRVVCWNTLSMALRQAGLTGEFRMRHDRTFNAAVKKEMETTLGLSESMDGYREQAEFLTKTRFREDQTVRYLTTVFEPELANRLSIVGIDFPKTIEAVNDIPKVAQIGCGRKTEEFRLLGTKSPLRKALRLVHDNPGHDLASARGTAWNPFNVVTYAIDHVLGYNNDNRAYVSMTTGATKKQAALDLITQMAKAA